VLVDAASNFLTLPMISDSQFIHTTSFARFPPFQQYARPVAFQRVSFCKSPRSSSLPSIFLA